jgi:hypothetical protein
VRIKKGTLTTDGGCGVPRYTKCTINLCDEWGASVGGNSGHHQTAAYSEMGTRRCGDPGLSDPGSTRQILRLPSGARALLSASGEPAKHTPGVGEGERAVWVVCGGQGTCSSTQPHTAHVAVWR